MLTSMVVIIITFLGLFSFSGEGHALQKIKLLEIANIPVWTLPEPTTFFYKSVMNIDADGAPDAYHPRNIGRDNLGNAGKKGNWWALVTDTGKPSGAPLIQGPDDPCPGYYISKTALEDNSKEETDPTRYVDSSKTPYLVLPPAVKRKGKARLGDFAVVINARNGKFAYAIFADIGPNDQLGEASIALAESLDIPSNPRTGGTGKEMYVIYLVFPGSGNGKPRPTEQINSEGARLFQQWGGLDRVKELFPD
jgi:hypothetical protein